MDVPLTVQLLAELGLSRYEAQAYLALLGHDQSTAVEVADRADVPRQRIYDVLNALREKALVGVRAGRPARYTARPPALALPTLLADRQRQQALENERLAHVIRQLVPDLESAGNGSAGLLRRMLRASQDGIGGF